MKKFSTTHLCCTLIFCALSFLLIAGCATVTNPQPFGEFSASVKELREGADAALQFNDEENREWFLNKAAEDIGDSERGADAIQALAIKGKGFSWYMEPTPLFMASKNFREGVYRLNTVLISYSELLESISASELVDVNEFDTMARDLNANVSSAAKAMNLDISGEADKGIAIFSIAASTAARLAVETKRKGKLLEALQKNQKQIQTLSTKLQEAVLIAVENLWEIYEDHKREFFRQLAEASSKSKNQRRKAVEEFLQWNEDFVHRLNVLESLYLAYGALPDAHRELASAQKESGMSLGSIKELQAQGRHLYDLYKDLSKIEE